VKGELLVQQFPQSPIDRVVAQAGEPWVGAKAGDFDAQPRQRLCDLDADRAEADDSHPARQRLQFEECVGGHDALAKGAPGVGDHRLAAAGDDDAPGVVAAIAEGNRLCIEQPARGRPELRSPSSSVAFSVPPTKSSRRARTRRSHRRRRRCSAPAPPRMPKASKLCRR
jgi:hypothetical protein